MRIQKIKTLAYQFLRGTQKYTGTDNVYLAKGGFWLTLSQVATMAVAFLTSIAFANLLEPSVYGNYNYVLSLAGILGIISLSGMWRAVNQATARGFENSFYTGFAAKLKWGLLAGLTAAGMAAYYWLRGNEVLPIPLLITAVFFPLMTAAGVYSAFLLGKKLFNVNAYYNIIFQVVSAAATIGALFLTKNIIHLIAVYFVSNTLLKVLLYLMVKLRFKPNRADDSETISYGKHLTFLGLINNVTNQLDKLLLFTFIGSVEMAVYSFAMAIPNNIKGILTNIGELALPKLAVRSKKEIKATLIKKVWKMFFLVGVIIALYILIAPTFYKIFFPKYLSSVSYSQIYIFSLLITPLSILNMTFYAKKMKKELYLLRFTGVARLVLLFVLIPTFGVLGAVLAMLGSELLGGALIIFLYYTSLRRVDEKTLKN